MECTAADFEWVEIPQVGEVYTYTLVGRAFDPWYAERVPYAVVVVALGDGIRLLGNCFGEELEQLDFGARVRAEFVHVGNTTLLDWCVAVEGKGNES